MDDALRKLQLTMLDMLIMFDRICKEHNLQYSLYAGTLLGAARHQGFIPWDDDLDVCMTREDYNKFLEIWPASKHEGYLLQNKENSPQFSQSFSKIRKDHTTFLQTEWEIGKYHTGIFIDIFPVDRLPQGRIARILFKIRAMIYQLYTREFPATVGNRLVCTATKIILLFTSHEYRMRSRSCLLKHLTAFNGNDTLPMVMIETMDSLRHVMPAELMDDFVEIPFEGYHFSCFSQWEKELKSDYGNWQELPPPEKRLTHHPVVLDFEKNYDEYQREKKHG